MVLSCQHVYFNRNDRDDSDGDDDHGHGDDNDNCGKRRDGDHHNGGGEHDERTDRSRRLVGVFLCVAVGFRVFVLPFPSLSSVGASWLSLCHARFSLSSFPIEPYLGQALPTPKVHSR